MNITIRRCTLFDLARGEIFFFKDSPENPMMALNDSKDGGRPVVVLATGEMSVVRAATPVLPCPNAELMLHKA